jgi:hypothetical protein
MGKTRFLTILAIVWLVISVSCKKSEKPEVTGIPAEAVHYNIQGEETAAATPLLFKLDGKADDWAGTAPFWEEAVPAGAGLGESGIDIKQVYFKNDTQYLYGFMRISPTIEERFKISPTGSIIGDLFLDTDNNPQTGSNAAEGYESDLYKGYEVRIHIPVGVLNSSDGQSVPLVGYEVYTHEGGFYGINYAARQDSTDEGALIAHGPDGVEFALSLEAMKLVVPATFRAMLSQHAKSAGEEGSSVGQLTLAAAK